METGIKRGASSASLKCVVPSFHKGGVRGGSCNLTDPQPPNLGGLGGDYALEARA